MRLLAPWRTDRYNGQAPIQLTICIVCVVVSRLTTQAIFFFPKYNMQNK
jgi:hypothetical protein